ncbi:hypothetical protein G4D82_13485 [Flavobacterium sp. CYK-4]|uniref:DUF5723 family protein n=1 Tax=Flavobacterium lotistagni TaxID=2709660 RepID=UPI00140A643B|nr:DUF5723 family protein [Flavobacterium lotistagni]NHM08236.1 hypothetical protein [Flavobacterium lotistagni]
MKKAIIYICLLASGYGFAQDHFIGVSTSSRTGLLNTYLNPAELTNLSKKYEVNINGLSVNVSNNILSMSDLNSDTDFEELIFKSGKTVNMNIDAEILGPGFAMKWHKWGFGLTTKGNVKFVLVDVDPDLGQSLFNTTDITETGTALINNKNNQRFNGISWGEVGLSAARNVFENDQHSFSAGLTLKLLFPGSYSNAGVDAFRGSIVSVYDANNPSNSTAYLTNASASLNFAYSGDLSDSFTNQSDYTQSIFGKLGGFGTDIGANYQWKDPNDVKKYKINVGMALRNIGSMSFKDSKNASNSYRLNVPQGQQLNLEQFSNLESLKDVEEVLVNSGYLTTEEKSTDFNVKLPATFSLYSDFKIYGKFFITGQLQQKLSDNEGNNQVTAQNNFSIIPRVSLGYFEAFLPYSQNEISGSNFGLGFRVGGFYLSSSSLITAISNDAKQFDLNFGFRWAFVE